MLTHRQDKYTILNINRLPIGEIRPSELLLDSKGSDNALLATVAGTGSKISV